MSFAYLFERFPSFSQTFCVREVLGIRGLAGSVPVFSIRRPTGEPEQNYPAAAQENVTNLPDDIEAALRTEKVPLGARLQRWRWLRKLAKEKDRRRAFEALWLGPQLLEAGVTHVHAHFAGIAARTAWWLKSFYGIHYSFTAHANDIFVENKDAILPLNDLVRDAAFVVAVSDFSRDWLCRRTPGFDEKIHRIYNGIDLEGFPHAAPAPGAPRIVTVGRYIEKKGFADLIDACAILQKRGRAFDCAIIGCGPLEEPLQARINALALNDCVHLTGPRSQAEVLNSLAAATLFVLPCATEPDGGMDTLPTVIVEAMAASLPVISTRLAAIPEMVEDGSTGLLVDEKSVEPLAQAMQKILDDPALAASMGAAGRLLAAERFDIRIVAAQLLEHLTKHGATALVPPGNRPRFSGRTAR